MSEQPDNNDIKSGMKNLSHVETRSNSNVKPIFKCQDCESVEDIAADILEKMNNDEPFQTPTHHDKPMLISVSQ